MESDFSDGFPLVSDLAWFRLIADRRKDGHRDHVCYVRLFFLKTNDEFFEILSPSSLLTMRAFMLDDVDFFHFDVNSTFFFLWK